jgi:predicted nucleotide-binding protein
MAASRKKQSVLICDDNEKNYAKLRKYLESEGFDCAKQVSTENEVREALRYAQEKKKWYQFVMLDMDLSMSNGPIINGAQLYHNILPDYPNETYIIYSGQDADMYRDEINMLMYRDVSFVLLDNLVKEKNIRLYLARVISRAEPSRVFLVHGRNLDKKKKLINLLEKGFGLNVVKWEDARERITTSRDYVYEIVMAGIEMSHLTIVLFTDDEIVQLRDKFKNADDRGIGIERRQSRSNVYIEAGYAFGVRPRRTIFVEWPDKGKFDFTAPSDFGGVHVVKFDGKENSRAILKNRLECARCNVQDSAINWRTIEL